jgi:hypothetical protein
MAMVVAMLLRPEGSNLIAALGLGLFVGVVSAGATWLALVHGVDNLFGAGFLLFRGKCPVCRAWFTPPTSFGPGSMNVDYSLPQFCTSCSAKLG